MKLLERRDGRWYFRNREIIGFQDVASIVIVYGTGLLLLGPFVWIAVGLYYFTEDVIDRHVDSMFSVIYVVFIALLFILSIVAWYSLVYSFIDNNFAAIVSRG